MEKYIIQVNLGHGDWKQAHYHEREFDAVSRKVNELRKQYPYNSYRIISVKDCTSNLSMPPEYFDDTIRYVRREYANLDANIFEEGGFLRELGHFKGMRDGCRQGDIHLFMERLESDPETPWHIWIVDTSNLETQNPIIWDEKIRHKTAARKQFRVLRKAVLAGATRPELAAIQHKQEAARLEKDGICRTRKKGIELIQKKYGEGYDEF